MAEQVAAHITGTVVRLEKARGEVVAPGEVVVVLESMKMEMEVTAPCDGIVAEILCQPGRSVQGGQRLLVLATQGA